ncbi:MAG TPA: hypothetical protein GXZ48_06670 [Acholeplasmataceae bacterium]|nr:hypothetical protein [Acholeplasmataceae bacterium]
MRLTFGEINLRGGIVKVSATLYEVLDDIINLYIGKFYIIENINKCTPINSLDDLITKINDYTLENPISKFDGMLLNPYSKKIYGLNASCNLIERSTNVIFDNIIIKDINIDGKNNQYIGGLISIGTSCFLNYFHISGTIKNIWLFFRRNGCFIFKKGKFSILKYIYKGRLFL